MQSLYLVCLTFCASPTGCIPSERLSTLVQTMRSAYAERTMWILKGIFIGFGLFVSGLVLTAIVSISFAFGRSQVQAQHATSLSVVYGWTIGNPLFYLGLLGCILIGVTVAGSWPKPVR